jgi:hypothetical protein
LGRRAATPGNGVHIAFSAPDRETVDAFCREVMKLDARDAGAPGLRPQPYCSNTAELNVLVDSLIDQIPELKHAGPIRKFAMKEEISCVLRTNGTSDFAGRVMDHLGSALAAGFSKIRSGRSGTSACTDRSTWNVSRLRVPATTVSGIPEACRVPPAHYATAECRRS